MTKAEQFFYEHAGYSIKLTETAEQGKLRCAQELAEAERIASNLGWQYEWVDDWEVGSHAKFYGPGSVYYNSQQEPDTCESCRIYDPACNQTLASLGCIDNADNNYRRVVEAELAEEALHEYDREIEILDAH